MAEYIVRETGYPGAVKQEVVGELVRCKDCIDGRCDVWLSGNGSAMGYGCCERTKSGILPNDFCSHAERREEGDK